MGADRQREPETLPARLRGLGPRSAPAAYGGMMAVVALATLAAWATHAYLDPSNLVMIFLVGVLVSAAAFGRGPGVVAAILSVAAFDFFFVPPRFTFAVADTQYLVTFAVMLATALTVATLASRVRRESVEAEGARVAVETERLRNALLSAVSHDLRTPLAVISGAATTLRDDATLAPETRHELAANIAEEGERLNRLVSNLLDLTRLESGAMDVHREWQSIEELVGSALGRLEPRLVGRAVDVRVAPDLPLVALDGVLIEQALFNLVDNALKYSPPGSPVGIAAALAGGVLRITVDDRGPGIAPGEETRLFEKFARSPRPGDPGGSGLGLAIVQGIARAHGGTVQAANRAGGGATFTLELPAAGEAPQLDAEEGEAGT